jgi:hypothetical protein
MALQVESTQLNGSNFDLTSLRGGLDDTSPYIALAPDACILAENVEFVNSTLGERRRGCTGITLSADMIASTLDATTWMYRHLPVNDEGEAELWTLTQSFTTLLNVLTRRKKTAWETIVPNDLIDSTLTRGHRISAQTLHGKLFLAYKSQGSIDRLHVYDGTSLRRCGLAEPSAPAVNNTGVGTFATTRYYRVRYIVQSGSTVIRSEPSDTTTFSPSGTGAAAQILKPATINENETHWEVEASLDNADFYRIATVVVGTSSYDDSTPAATGYAAAGVLSADIGDYATIPSGKFLSADQDRLIIAGSWETSAEASRVRWTPVYGDPTGDGNDERLELDTDPYLDLDGFEGGEITGMSRAVNGYIFVFKRGHIYRMVRTGQRNKAYDAVPITKARGALPGSLVEAINQAGQPSLYFLDQSVGPTRLSANGLQWCGRDIQTFWQRVNINAKVPCHGVYYNNKRQLHYWVAVDGSDYPNAKIVLHVNEMRDTDEGGRRGWVTVAMDNRIATAHCSAMFASNIDTTDSRSFSLVPLIGKEKWSVGLNTIRDYIQRCDTGGTDAHTTDDTDSTYRATVTTKPFALAGLLNQHEIKSGVLLTKAASEPNGSVFIRLIQDFGLNEKTVDAPLYTPTANETHSIQLLDGLGLAEVTTLQISMGDLSDNVIPPDEWELHRLQLKVTGGATA